MDSGLAKNEHGGNKHGGKKNRGNKHHKNNPAPQAPYRFKEGVLTVQLRVQPGAARDQWGGAHGEEALKLRLMAPAVDGKANRACLKFLAEAAGVPRRNVSIVRGEFSRDKSVRIAPLTESQYRALKKQWQS